MDDGFDFALLHGFADLPVDDEATGAIEDTAEEVKGTGDVEVADIHVPLLMRLQRLDEAGAFLGDIGRWPGQQAELFQDAIRAGRAAGDDILIKHHEGHAAISIVGVRSGEVADTRDLVLGEPVIARHPGVVLVDPAVTLTPVVELALGDAQPSDEVLAGDLGFVGPSADEIDDGVAGVVGNPSTA